MLENNFFKPDILSKREELFVSVINSKVIKMVRYGLEPKEKFSEQYNISDEKKAFSLCEGALLIEFDNGISLAFNSDEEICSIISWAEQYGGKHSNNMLKNEDELFPINANDPNYSTKYFSDIINQKLVRYEIIKQEPFSPTYFALPREVGLQLIFSGGYNIMLSHQLTKLVSDNFTILEIQDINQDIYQTLYKMSCFW